MPHPPAVTVITATYNRAAFLAHSLRSLQRQTFADFEALVVGDGCTDPSAEVVAALADPRFRWINLPRNSGNPSAPNNAGLSQARGPLVAYLAHDDLWLPDHLAGLVATLDATGADLAHPLLGMIGPAGPHSTIGPPRGPEGYRHHELPSSGWLHRRELAERIGGWRPSARLFSSVDTDVLRRASQAGARFAYRPQLTVLAFPSIWWQLYAYAGEPPQASYLAAILADPEALRTRVLTAIAANAPFPHPPAYPPHAALAGVARWAWRSLLTRYGRDRWPLRQLLIWRYQRHRRRQRRRRGIAHNEG